MEEEDDFRCWGELIPDALALIFGKLSLQEILTVIPRVCKSWGKAVAGPYCWQEIDIEEWSHRSKPEHLDRMLQMLITRSCGSLRKLCVSGLHNDPIFSFLAEHAGSLQTLCLPGSEMSDATVEQIAERLVNIRFLDVSYCEKLGARGLEAIGKHCRSLVVLKRSMHPSCVAGKYCQDEEAFAIANTMPKLKHLEMAYVLLTTDGVRAILGSCSDLEFLDVRGCWNVKLDDRFLADKCGGLKILGPRIVDNYERMYSDDDCSDYTDSSGYSAWDFAQDAVYDEGSDDGGWEEDEQGLEGFELRFYDGFSDNVSGFGWPPSP